MKLALKTGLPSFAHLMGRAPAAVPPMPIAATNDKKRDDETQEEFETRRDRDSAASDELEQGDDETDEDFEKRKKEKAEDNKLDDETDEAHAARVAANASRRARRAQSQANGEEDHEGDDDSDGADMRNQAIASPRLRERARCAAIFLDPAAGKNPVLAATLAFHTDLPRSQAIAVLRAGGVPANANTQRNTLDRRMAQLAVPPIAAGDPARPPPSNKPPAYDVATQVIVAGMKRDGEKPEAIAAYIQARAITA